MLYQFDQDHPSTLDIGKQWEEQKEVHMNSQTQIWLDQINIWCLRYRNKVVIG